MSNNITIIGLGEIGSSLAMAFKKQENVFTITGSDFLKSAERRAEENHWTDRIEHNLFSAAEEADVVILAIPADQTKKVLELIGHDLKEDTVILDFCPNKKAASGWANNFLNSRTTSWVSGPGSIRITSANPGKAENQPGKTSSKEEPCSSHQR